MDSPLFYILAPFGLAIALFAAYCVLSLLLGDPARPFRMFAAGPIPSPADEARRLLKEIEVQGSPPMEGDPRLERLLSLTAGREGPEWDDIRRRSEPILREAGFREGSQERKP